MGRKGTEKDRIVGKNVIEGRRTDGNRRRRTENVREQILRNKYYYNTTPQFSVSDQHVNIRQHFIINNIASSSRTNFPPLNNQFRAYNPQNLK